MPKAVLMVRTLGQAAIVALAMVFALSPPAGAESSERVLQDRLEAWISDDPEREWMRAYDLDDPAVVQFVLERLPGFDFYEDGLRDLVSFPAELQRAVNDAVNCSDEVPTIHLVEMVLNLRVSEHQAQAILAHVSNESGDKSREYRGVERALEKLRECAFTDTWESRLLRDGGAMVGSLPKFVAGSIFDEKLADAQAPLADAQARLDAINRAIASGQRVIRATAEE